MPAFEPVPVTIPPMGLRALLGVPAGAQAIVVFAHGSGSGRFSPRNNHVARALRTTGLATLLIDLLTPIEEADRANVFDIPLLASRLSGTANWVERTPELAGMRIGYFGASTGAGAALLAASYSGDPARAIVSRGGRPDLAGSAALARVRAPTLLIVGGNDGPVIALNRMTLPMLGGEGEMVIVPGAGHLFEEPGTLDQVIEHARRWFLRHLMEE